MSAVLEAPATGEILLSPGQDAAMTALVGFLMDPDQSVFVLSGYSGTGKSTLVKTILNRLPGVLQVCQLIHADLENYKVELTATTNKAVENFAYITKKDVVTIQSFLGLMVKTDYDVHPPRSELVSTRKSVVQECRILFIDEASFIDAKLLNYIFRFTNRCKIIFIGDPAQLLNPGSNTSPVFDAGYPGAQLTEVMRQPGGGINPITELATKFRHMVNTGEAVDFTPDGVHVQHLSQDDFEAQVIAEFSRDNWSYHDSKVLAYTNARVIQFNHAIRDLTKGSPHFEVGDYAVCNSYVAGDNHNAKRVKTDQTVLIKGIEGTSVMLGVKGRKFHLDAGFYFVPDSLPAWKAQQKALHVSGEYSSLQTMEATFMDLRAAYACTINKSQGSTFDRVYIDLNDVAKCRDDNTLARLMYVGVSRARHQVFLTGDIA